jgi:hypothetical protein
LFWGTVVKPTPSRKVPPVKWFEITFNKIKLLL